MEQRSMGDRSSRESRLNGISVEFTPFFGASISSKEVRSKKKELRMSECGN